MYMKKLALLCIAALGSALFVLGTAPSASAYPEVTCDVTVDRQVLDPGDSFTATGTAKAIDDQGNVVDPSNIHWSFRWNGVTKLRTGTPVHATFTAPEVTHTRVITLTARAETPQGPCVHHIDITVIGAEVAGPGGGGHLPSTGGPAFWIMVAALALLLVGGGTVVVSRKRH
jgi:LPXTG-motif cell wall-anchored protein